MKAYRFKITLKGSKPPVWRRIDVPASMRFSMLSDVIQTLFGFDGYHLSSFDFRELPFSLRSYTEEDD
ncbi:MAG: hypothetical protein IKS32_00210, partial [Solobacterium sp.]|nr:hypothetical protein [Solobacterium sp.]